jgi:hypothetical protein
LLREESIAQKTHPTLNIEHRASNVVCCCSWALGVRRSMLDVFLTSYS